MQRDDVINNAPGSPTCQHTSVEVACLHACNHVREREGTDGLTHRYDSSLMGWCFVLSRIEGHVAVEAHSSISVLELNAINQVNYGGRGRGVLGGGAELSLVPAQHLGKRLFYQQGPKLSPFGACVDGCVRSRRRSLARYLIKECSDVRRHPVTTSV